MRLWCTRGFIIIVVNISSSSLSLSFCLTHFNKTSVRASGCVGVPSEPIVFFFLLMLTGHAEQSPPPGLNANEVVVQTTAVAHPDDDFLALKHNIPKRCVWFPVGTYYTTPPSSVSHDISIYHSLIRRFRRFSVCQCVVHDPNPSRSDSDGLVYGDKCKQKYFDKFIGFVRRAPSQFARLCVTHVYAIRR